ncbi:hypothetical protein NEMBOFW57_010935 [Staphylotrichum longicolle]|uniref:DNA2/NAM7 helicase-like C-terminal domain-containing protein n=1 Tax=Staphylotrichum longicolle TaxID=669026 RepID=A0AAD4ESD8_9PEZI|nr:hypothetical protein NEMBOFW57_010935 [Staphylotrichum longicolle]
MQNQPQQAMPGGEFAAGAKSAPRKKPIAYTKDCALLAGPSGPVIATGKSFGADISVLRARLITSTVADPWMGFSLSFPLGDKSTDNEAAGFGVRYTIRLPDGARIKVDGFGMPFANFENTEVEWWVNNNEPIVDGATLLDLVRKREFHFLVLESPIEVQKKWSEEHLPPPFTYPYGTEHDWNWDRYRTLLLETKSTEQFRPAYSFDDDNARVAVLTQSVVQDVFWLQEAVEAISDFWAPAYFVSRGVDDRRYYVVIPLTKEFRERFEAAWARLAKDNDAILKLASGSDEDGALAECGFYDWMTSPSQTPETEEPNIEAMANLTLGQQHPPVRALPVVNFLDIPDDRYTWALLEETLPGDRAPFRQYMTRRHLGLGIITAAPGFGKTSLLSVAGLAMQASLGKILCSGPTNVAVDNLASRLNTISTSVCRRYNDGKSEDDPSRQRRRLVVRAYMVRQETTALMQLLRFPDKEVSLGGKSAWKLHLSIAYWCLMLLGSKARGIGELTADDSEALHKLRRDIEGRAEFTHLRAVAAREMSWADFSKTKYVDLQPLLGQIVLAADLLCVTPARSAELRSPCLYFKKRLAAGILIDEAANMNIPDYVCVAGNCLVPCVLGGDPRQLKPVSATGNQKDEHGNFYHRLAEDATMSPLAFLQASGIPVYRLSLQLRMARGLFDWVGAEVYPEIDFQYAQHCNILRASFASGRALEARARARFPEIAAAGLVKFSPLFLHCEGSRVFVDKTTKSKLCPVQARATLDFALDLVKNTEIKAADIAILCPYAANVQFINKLMKRPGYAALEGMPHASTVDAYQGQESDIVLVTMGTTFPYPGPGFTTDEHRLNVLLTRQRCGLVVVGDINIDGKQDKKEKKEKARPGHFMVRNAEGKVHWTKALMLHNIYKRFVQEKRVMRLPPPPTKDNVVDGPAA